MSGSAGPLDRTGLTPERPNDFGQEDASGVSVRFGPAQRPADRTPQMTERALYARPCAEPTNSAEPNTCGAEKERDATR